MTTRYAVRTTSANSKFARRIHLAVAFASSALTALTAPAALGTLAIGSAALAGCAGANDSAAIAPDAVDSPNLVGSSEHPFEEASQLLGDLVSTRGLQGAGLIVVDRDEGVVHEEYWGAFHADRISLVASASKMLTAGVLLRLADEGLVDLDEPIAESVPWGSGNPEVTLAQLLSNSSGLVGIYPNPVYEPYICQYLPIGSLQDCAASIFQSMDDDADVVAPDTEFRYGGAQWQVAGAVAEAVSGRSWAELIEETYIQPCDLSPGSLGYNNPITQMGNGIDYPSQFAGDPSTLVPTTNPNLESGAYATPRVFGQLLQMYLNRGECEQGHRVLSEGSVARALSDRVAESYNGSAALDRGYGLGWWVNRKTALAYSVGAYGAVPAIHLEQGFGYYLVLEANDAAWRAVEAPLERAITEAIATVRNDLPLFER